MFSELRAELGPEKAADLMGRAIRQRGVKNAGKYASFAPGDLEGLKQAFVGKLPDDGAMFAPEVVHTLRRSSKTGHRTGKEQHVRLVANSRAFAWLASCALPRAAKELKNPVFSHSRAPRRLPPRGRCGPRPPGRLGPRRPHAPLSRFRGAL
jgi:hypothetical protein